MRVSLIPPPVSLSLSPRPIDSFINNINITVNHTFFLNVLITSSIVSLWMLQAFFLLLSSDVLVGYHSADGWQTALKVGMLNRL